MSEMLRATDVVAPLRAAFVDALRSRDVAKACSVYAADAQLLPPAGPSVRGRAEIGSYWQAGLDTGVTSIELETVEVVEHADLAYEIGRYALHFEPADEVPVVERGHYVQIHQQTADGAWERTVEIFSPGGGG